MAAITKINVDEELPAINQILSSIGQAPVTTLDQTNPDVAIALNALREVNTEVQAEGWAFNTEYEIPKPSNNSLHYELASNILQMDLSSKYKGDMDVVWRRDPADSKLKLYDRYNHKFEIGTVAGEEFDFDIIYHFDFIDVPLPIQNYITAKAVTIVAQRIIGDAALVQTLQQREALARSVALEYECNQADYSIFGHPQGRKNYTSYKPYTALQR